MNTRHKLASLCLVLYLGSVGILTLPTTAAGTGFSELLRLRRGVQKTSIVTFTRLVLEVKGERPTSIEAISSEQLVISFKELRTGLEPQIQMSDPTSTVTTIKVLDSSNGSQVQVHFRTPDCVVSHSFLPPQKPAPGVYRLMLDILPPAPGKTAEGGGKDPKAPKAGAGPSGKSAATPTGEVAPHQSKAPAEPAKGPGAAANNGVKPVQAPRAEPSPAPTAPAAPRYREIAEGSLSEPLRQANGLLAEQQYEQAHAEYARLLKEPGLSRDESSVAAYGLADSAFFLNQQELDLTSKEITTKYLAAIKADPTLIQAGWAYYRLGLTHVAAGEPEKALKAFQAAVQDYPGHPVALLCWLELGAIHQKTGSLPQAVNAFRAALELPLEPAQRLNLLWLLGTAQHGMGEYDAAAETFEQCLTEDPKYYLAQPLILKYLGDCHFFRKQYDRSRDLLLWYLNLQPEAPHRALVLAKIAEIFSAQDQPEFAGKLFDHIQSDHPNSDGDIIAQIRRAELLKSKGKLAPEEDLGFFRELARKPFSPQLTKLIHLKLALREHEYGNFDASFGVIEGHLQESLPPASNEDFLALRRQVISDWLHSAHQNRDYGTVIVLYERHQDAFPNAHTVEFQRMIADSYAGIQQYRKAISLYEGIMAKQGAEAGAELILKTAETALLAKDFERAENLCNQVQGADHEAGKKRLLARMAFAQQQYARAVEYLGSLPETELTAVGTPSLSAILAESLAHLGECDKAAHWLQKTSEQMEQTDTHSDDLVQCYLIQAGCYRKSGAHDKAIAVLEEAATIAGTAHQRDQLHYDISKHYLELGQTERAIEKLTSLMGSNQTFWQTAAKQQLEYIQLERQ